MKIAILGSGGREHALAIQISKSKKLDKLYCIPGNAGTNFIGKNINLNLDNFSEIYNFLNKQKISNRIYNIDHATNILRKLLKYKKTKKNIKNKINAIGQKILKKNMHEINIILKNNEF